MNTVGEYITHASSQLNDQRYNRAFTRWRRDLLLDYMNLGLAEIGTYFPDEFTKDVIVTLKPGREQSVPDTKNRIIAVKSNEDGSPINEMDSVSSDIFSAYAECAPSISFVNGSPVYRAVGYAIRSENPRAFTVDPPVPDGLNPKVVVTLDGAVPQYTLADWNTPHDIPPKYINALMDFILGKALNLNAESTTSQVQSREHLRLFYSVLGINYKQSSRYNSGYYNGEKGTGDERVTRG